MPARTLQFDQAAYYHIYNRGAGRQPIFRKETNYLFVLRRMQQIAAENQITIVASCLMPNHYHWLVRQDGEQSAGLLPQHVFNSYTKAYNKMYERTGTLFEARFKAKHIASQEYLLHLCRYIHANPIKDRIVSTLAEWPYSNYHEWIGARSGRLVDQAFITGMFPDRSEYVKFVQDYIVQRCLPNRLDQYLTTLERE